MYPMEALAISFRYDRPWWKETMHRYKFLERMAWDYIRFAFCVLFVSPPIYSKGSVHALPAKTIASDRRLHHSGHLGWSDLPFCPFCSVSSVCLAPQVIP